MAIKVAAVETAGLASWPKKWPGHTLPLLAAAELCWPFGLFLIGLGPAAAVCHVRPTWLLLLLPPPWTCVRRNVALHTGLHVWLGLEALPDLVDIRVAALCWRREEGDEALSV